MIVEGVFLATAKESANAKEEGNAKCPWNGTMAATKMAIRPCKLPLQSAAKEAAIHPMQTASAKAH